MVLIRYEVGCPFCNTLHRGEIEMKYRKDNKFNVRKNNKNIHRCNNKNCNREFVVEIDSYGVVTAIPTKKAEEEGIRPWEKLLEGRIIEIIEN